MIAAVFKCVDTPVMDSHSANRKVVVDRWKAAFNQYKVALGVEGLHGIEFYDGGWTFNGYLIPAGQEPQHGWRRDSKRWDHALPAKRTEEGRALARELSSLDLPGITYPGVPNILHSETVDGLGYSIFPRAEKIGHAWWLTLSKVPRQTDAAKISAEVWESAKLSEYFAAKESAGE